MTNMHNRDADLGAPVLKIEKLQTWFDTRAGIARAVDGVDLELYEGEILGLVGESGSGKSVTGYSMMGLIDPPGRIASGRILLDGRDLTQLSAEEQRRMRGKDIAMIFQDPSMTLNPTLRIETQMIEAVRAHEACSKAQARRRAKDALDMVGIPSAEERLRAYPFELSGGMRQRVAIAIALLNKPRLIVADEPTTALDVSIQSQIIYELQTLCRDTGTAMIWVTHDLAVVAGMADRLAVMYAGRIVEEGTTAEVIQQPRHPYTRGLMGSVPMHETRGQRLARIPGSTPSLLNLPEGCSFRERCAFASPSCQRMPELTQYEQAQSIRCWHPQGA
ncbi:ABC transporter ATP-binding protein [Celeribacter sp. ULVN23_4]